MARVVLGVTGGIAAYKAAELTRLLVKDGHEVIPVLTPGAESFVAAKTFEALARNDAARELYPHLVRADALVIAETPVSETGLAADLTALGMPFHEIGDAVAPRRASLSFFEARELARRL
jgi:3-polyprenyl-4-hydroxybenzoate decarboxylase